MNNSLAKQLRRLAKVIESNPQYKGIPFKTIYKKLKKDTKTNMRNGVGRK